MGPLFRRKLTSSLTVPTVATGHFPTSTRSEGTSNLESARWLKTGRPGRSRLKKTNDLHEALAGLFPSAPVNAILSRSLVVEMRMIGPVVVGLVLLIAAPAPSAPMPKQGGAALITFNNDLTTLDPQVGYDWQNWSAIKSIFDGLMDYKPGTARRQCTFAMH
jgi:hypothetical protein